MFAPPPSRLGRSLSLQGPFLSHQLRHTQSLTRRRVHPLEYQANGKIFGTGYSDSGTPVLQYLGHGLGSLINDGDDLKVAPQTAIL